MMSDVTKPTSGRAGKLIYIQYLRGFAALLVVFHHSRNSAPWLFNPLAETRFGLNGVDIFFVISGFIMFTAARGEPPLEFCRRRIVRVAPMYWIATFCLIALSVIGVGKPPFDIAELLQSLFFIPHYNPYRAGQVTPYLVPGWTLNYEMFFYAIFALAIFSQRILLTTSIIIVPLVVYGFLFDTKSAIVQTFTSEMLAEFLTGVFVAKAYLLWKFRNLEWVLIPAVPALVLSDLVEGPRILAIGLPAAAMIIGILALQERRPAGKNALLKLIGDASYSIYLFHMLGLLVWWRIMYHIPLTGWPQFIVHFAVGMIGSTIGGILIYKLVENPLIAWINRSTIRWTKKKTPALV